MTNTPDFIEINPKDEVDKLIKIYEDETDTKLYPAQDAMILIKIMAYLSTLLQTKFNDSAKLNLVQHSRFPILDFLGEMKKCKRLKSGAGAKALSGEDGAQHYEDESDDDYRERILLSPEGFSVAGPELAYIYFALCADSDIKDVSVHCPDDDIKVTYNDETTILQGNEAVVEKSTADFDIKADYNTGEVILTLNKNFSSGEIIKIKVPHPFELILYILTKTGTASEELLKKVEDFLKPTRPLSDCVKAKSAEIEEFVISGTIFLKKDAVKETVEKSVNEVLNAFLNDFQDVLNKSVVRNQIITSICNIQGVFDFDLETPKNSLEAKKNTSYKGSIGNLKYERVINE